MNLSKIILITTALLAACAPFLFSNLETINPVPSQFPGWPSDYEGKLLTQLELTNREEFFVKGFPGKIGRFSDGSRELIIRWVERPTRKLHPAADCFKGIGYYITPKPIQVNELGIKMGCFNASKGSSELTVCEFIEQQDGNNLSDISAWFWGAMMSNNSKG